MKKITLFILGLCFIPGIASAASFYFDYPNEVKTEESLISVKLDTEGEKVNALAGKIALPKNISVSKFLTGKSSIVLWIEAPHVVDGAIQFSGITPGGFSGDNILFSFTLGGGAGDAINLSVKEGEVHRNDLFATDIITKSVPAYVSISNLSGKFMGEDTIPPEAFVPIIASNSTLFEGKKFLAFEAHDKGLGIAKYEWASSLFGEPNEANWQSAQSPLLLPNKAYWGKIYVRATDNAGNTTLGAVNGLYYYAVLWFEAIIILLILCILLFFVRPLL